MTTKIIALLDTETNGFISFGTKIAWASVGAAKQAYAYHKTRLRQVKGFAEQSRYVVVDLTETYYRLEGLEK